MIELRVELASPANDMVQEEIVKQIAHVSRAIGAIRFLADDRTLVCQADDTAADPAALQEDVARVARKIQQSLRKLERKVVYRSAAGWDRPTRRVDGAGIWNSGPGQVQLSGAALCAVQALRRILDGYIATWSPVSVQTPILIPASVLARCDYFRSFPQYVSFVSHLHEEFATIDGFRQRHRDRDTLDEGSRQDFDIADVCLSPAVCYHMYHRHAGETLPPRGVTYDVAGRCFRYESTNLSDLRRLWEFTMRELVFVGTRDWVLAERQRAIDLFIPILDQLALPTEIRTASDPFFVAPDAAAKTYFQLSSETKYEISVGLEGEERLAVGSFNYHTDFFGQAFKTQTEDQVPAHSVCVAFGLERLAHAVLAHFGTDPGEWPTILRP